VDTIAPADANYNDQTGAAVHVDVSPPPDAHPTPTVETTQADANYNEQSGNAVHVDASPAAHPTESTHEQSQPNFSGPDNQSDQIGNVNESLP